MNAEPMAEGRSPRFFGALESMRGGAALLVVLFHVSWPNPLSDLRLIKNGYLMVDFFFILSGFVICQSYARRIANGTELRRFILLRFGRIYPLHFAVMLGFLALEFIKYAGFHSAGLSYRNGAPFTVNNGGSFLTNALLIQPFGFYPIWTFNSVSWSIAVEFHTYLLFGVLVLWVGRMRRLIWLAFFLTLVMGGILVGSGNLGLTTTEHTAQWSIFRCGMGFFLGVLVSAAFDHWQTRIAPRSEGVFLGTMVVAMVLLAVKETGFSDYAVLPLFAVIILVTAALPEGPLRRLLNCRLFRWLGKVSYSIYMVHALIIILLARFLPAIARKMGAAAAGAAGGSWLGKPPVIGTLFLGLAVGMVMAVAGLTYSTIEARGQRFAKNLAARWFDPPG